MATEPRMQRQSPPWMQLVLCFLFLVLAGANTLGDLGRHTLTGWRLVLDCVVYPIGAISTFARYLQLKKQAKPQR